MKALTPVTLHRHDRSPRLLATPPRGAAVTFGYGVVAHSDTDLHRADVAPSRAHSPPAEPGVYLCELFTAKTQSTQSTQRKTIGASRTILCALRDFAVRNRIHQLPLTPAAFDWRTVRARGTLAGDRFGFPGGRGFLVLARLFDRSF